MTSIPNKDPSIRERWLIGATLAAAIALCWAWIAPMALDMYGPMSGCSAWMMTGTWDFTHQALLFAMWAVMMIGMMLPSAAPAVFHYASVVRSNGEGERVLARVLEPLNETVATRGEPIDSVLGCDFLQCCGDGCDQGLQGSGFGSPQQRFDLCSTSFRWG